MSRTLGRVAGAVLGFALAGAHAQSVQLPEGPGANLVYARCQTCHSLQYVVEAKGLLPGQWQSVLQSMKDYGLRLSDAEATQILQYLTTYLGSHPPAQTSAPSRPQPEPASANANANGASVYEQQCVMCHGEHGQGEAGSFPPLAGNPDLAGNRDFPVLVLLHGLTGPIEVNGSRFDGVMPPFASLTDAEIASVVNHIRAAWGTSASAIEPVTADLVARLRKQEMAPEQVRAARRATH